jgi:hypothetical protein
VRLIPNKKSIIINKREEEAMPANERKMVRNKVLTTTTRFAPKDATAQLAKLSPVTSPTGMADSTVPKAALLKPSFCWISGIREDHVADNIPEIKKNKAISNRCFFLSAGKPLSSMRSKTKWVALTEIVFLWHSQLNAATLFRVN